MWRGWAAWVWVWVWLPCLTHTHSTLEDPHLNPRKAAVLTSLLLQDTEHQLSNHLALEVQGGEEAARSLSHKYGLHYVCQVFKDPPVYYLHKPTNSSHHHHHHHRYHRHHHRVPRSTPDLVQLLANEPGVKWVHQQRGIVREKRHRVPGCEHANAPARPAPRGTRSRPAPRGMRSRPAPRDMRSRPAPRDMRSRPAPGGMSSTDRMTKQVYESMRLWQEEEQLGLQHEPGYSLREGNTHSHYQGGITDAKDRSPIDNTSSLPADEEATGKTHVTDSNQNSIQTNNEEEANYNEDTPQFNDPLFKVQWYLHNTGQLGHAGCDLNVTRAWQQGFTGRGVTLSILDDGFQTTNADLAGNYNAAVSYSLIHDGQPESDPSPRLDPPQYTNSHGTYCAGVVAAVANNGVCGVGVAYNAKVGGVRMVDGMVTDVQEATALSRHVDEVAVFSASWGPKDDGAHVEGPGRLARRALLYGVTVGRAGLGTIYVWASGNGGMMSDNCNLDGYASSIYTLTVSALTDLGKSTFYSESCASSLAGVYVGGQHLLSAALELRHFEMKVVVPELDGHCSNKFQGSSAAAPLMAGIVALTLQANPRLGWRDVQHLVVAAAAPTPAALTEPGWHINAQGKKFHLLQGFGAINAGRMVEAARTWQNVGPQKVEELVLFEGNSDLLTGWTNMSQELQVTSLMTVVEHVMATVTLNHPKRSLLNIYIVSPSGTTSQVLTHRPQDTSRSGFHAWEFMSVHLWGEEPVGTWGVAIKCDSKMTGRLFKVHLTVYGY